MGSSVMVASTMKNRLSRYGVEVAHTAVDQIPSDTPLILTQEGLVDRARRRAPSARIVPFTNYMNDPAFDRVETEVRAAHDDAATAPTDNGGLSRASDANSHTPVSYTHLTLPTIYSV